MGAVLDPAGDPILDPDGAGITTPGLDYVSEVLVDNPTAYWTFDGGATTDVTGNGNDLAAVVGVPTHLTDGPVLSVNDAYAVDNGHGWACPSPGTLPTDGTRQFTVEAWVRGASFSNQVLFYQDAFYTERSWHVAGQGGKGRAVASNTAGNTWVEGSGTVFDGTWHHYVVTVDCAADEVKFYIDGALDVTRTDPQIGDASNGAQLRLGSGFEGGPGATVDIAHVALYLNTVLPSDRVAAHYDARNTLPSTPVLPGRRITVHGGDLAPRTPPNYYQTDPFNRPSINPPPWGGTYEGYEYWTLDTTNDQIHPVAAAVLLYDTQRLDQDVSVKVVSTHDNAGNGGAIVIYHESFSQGVWVFLRNDSGIYSVQVKVYDDIFPSGSVVAGTTVSDFTGQTLRAVLTGNQLNVKLDGFDVFATYLPLFQPARGFDFDNAGKVGIYGDGPNWIFDDLTIHLPPAIAASGHATVHGGDLTPEGIVILEPGHATIHGGGLAPFDPYSITVGKIRVHGGNLTVSSGFSLEIEGAHATIHGGDVDPKGTVRISGAQLVIHGGDFSVGYLALEAAHLTVSASGVLRAVIIVGQGGSASYPIGFTPIDLSSLSIVDEGGNQIVDENGDVLVFD